jgi:hypothetical protein
MMIAMEESYSFELEQLQILRKRGDSCTRLELTKDLKLLKLRRVIKLQN